MGDRVNVSMRVGRGRHDSRCLRPDDGSGQVVRLERTCAAPSRECVIQASSGNHGRPDAELIESCGPGVNLGGCVSLLASGRPGPLLSPSSLGRSFLAPSLLGPKAGARPLARRGGEAAVRSKMFVRVSNSWSMLPTCGNFEEKASYLRIRSRAASRLGA